MKGQGEDWIRTTRHALYDLLYHHLWVHEPRYSYHLCFFPAMELTDQIDWRQMPVDSTSMGADPPVSRVLCPPQH